MPSDYVSYKSMGANNKAQIYMTPEIHIWRNSKKTQKKTKEQFDSKISKIVEDIITLKRPSRGSVKIIPKCQIAVFQIRLNDRGERILFDYKFELKDDIVINVQLYILAVSNKKNIQKMLEYSAQHKVHASSLDNLRWNHQAVEEISLENIHSLEELDSIRLRAKISFDDVMGNDKENEWTEENYWKRIEHATIYDFRLPNFKDPKNFSSDDEIPEILKLQHEQDRILEENNPQLLLEGVAGTGKTTMLLYRFVGNVKAMLEQKNYLPDELSSKFLFVTHNKRLRDEVKANLRYFFDEDLTKQVEKCILSVEDALRKICGIRIDISGDVSAEVGDYIVVHSNRSDPEKHNFSDNLEITSLVRDDSEKIVGIICHPDKLIKSGNEFTIQGDSEKFIVIENTIRNGIFDPKQQLTRERFKKILSGREIDTDMFWEEYRGVLRGYNLHGGQRIVSKEVYTEQIGRRRGRLNIENRNDFYDVAEKLEYDLQRDNRLNPSLGGWDDLDVCQLAINMIQTNGKMNTLDFLYIDEIQDLTIAEIEVFLNLLDSQGLKRLSMAGDLSQSVQPSAFTWQALRDQINQVLGIKVRDEERLDQNFRSTPYLVQAANSVLEMIGEYEGEIPRALQRPFAGENHGERLLRFDGTEDDLIKLLLDQGLPNSGCVLLVRGEEEKKRISKIIDHDNQRFVETITKFKGLEERNILLWDIVSGSDRVLDLLHHEKRGEIANKNHANITTAVIELKHVFVALTRARYLCGILAPKEIKQDKQQFLDKRFNGKDFFEVSGSDKFELFSTDADDSILEKSAEKYVAGGLFGMASDTYRNMFDKMHESHYYNGKYHLEEENYLDAVKSFIDAIDEGGQFDEECAVYIAEYCQSAFSEIEDDEQLELMKSKVLSYASNYLDDSLKDIYKAETEESKGNFEVAAQLYIKAGLSNEFQRIVDNVQEPLKKAQLYILSQELDKAEKLVKDYLSKEQPKQALLISMGERAFADVFGEGNFTEINDRFTKNLIWAEKLVKKDELKRFRKMVKKLKEKEILDKPSDDLETLEQQMQILFQNKEYGNIKKKLKAIESTTNFNFVEIHKKYRLKLINEKGNIREMLLEFDSEGVTIDDLLNKHLTRLKKHLEHRPLQVFNSLRKLKSPLMLYCENSTNDFSQRLICLTILERYERGFRDKNITIFDRLRSDLLQDYIHKNRRRNQPILKGCASLIATHIFDLDHPFKSKQLQPQQTFAANVQNMLHWNRKLSMDDITFLLSSYLVGKHMKKQPLVSELNNCNVNRLLFAWKDDQISRLVISIISHSDLKIGNWQYDRIVDALKIIIPEFYIRGFFEVLGANKDFTPKKYEDTQLPGILPADLSILSKKCKKNLQWFVTKLFMNDKNLRTIWDCIFIGEEESKTITIELTPVIEKQDKVEEKISAEEENEELSSDEDLETLDDLIQEEMNPIEIETIETFQQFEIPKDIVQTIENLEGNERGRNTERYLREMLKIQIEKMAAKEQSDHLCRAFDATQVAEIPDWLKFAIMNVIKDMEMVIDEDTNITYQILSRRQQNDYIQFKQNPKRRSNVMNSTYYAQWQRILH